MTDNLVERLLKKRMRVHDLGGVGFEIDQDCVDAASEITRLQEALAAAEAQVAKMLELIDAARPFAALIERQDATDVAWLVKLGANPDDLTSYQPDWDKVHSSGELQGALFLTRGDFRRLAAAIRSLSNEKAPK